MAHRSAPFCAQSPKHTLIHHVAARSVRGNGPVAGGYKGAAVVTRGAGRLGVPQQPHYPTLVKGRGVIPRASGEEQPPPDASSTPDVEGQERGAVFEAGFAVLLLLGLAQIVAPSWTVQLAFAACPLPLVEGLVRLLGNVFVLAALALHTLQDAALHNRLGSETYQRLGLGLVWWALLSLVAIWTSPAKPLLRPHLAVSGLLGLVAAFAGAVYSQTSPQGLNPVFLAKEFFRSTASLLSVQNIWAAVYAVYTAAAAGAAAAVWVASSGAGWAPASLSVEPLLAYPLGAVGGLVVQLLAAGAVLLAVVLYTLKDAASRGRLGASTFKTLSVGVLSLALGLASTAATEPSLLASPQVAAGTVAASSVLAFVAGYTYLFAKKSK